MVLIHELWLPILVSTVLVFVASNLVWMVLPHHKSDARRLPDEAGAIDALGKQGLKPGLYRFPWANSMAEMKDPAFVEKLNKGPVALLTVIPSGPFNMGRAMGLWTALPGRGRHLRRLPHRPRARRPAPTTSRSSASRAPWPSWPTRARSCPPPSGGASRSASPSRRSSTASSTAS